MDDNNQDDNDDAQVSMPTVYEHNYNVVDVKKNFVRMLIIMTAKLMKRCEDGDNAMKNERKHQQLQH